MSKQHIRLIMSDIDGTLIPVGGELSAKTVRALELCREQGIYFGLASGRWLPSVASVAESAGITGPLISANGGCVSTPDGEILKEFSMPEDESRAVFDIIRDCGAMITGYVRGRVYRLNTASMGGRNPSTLRQYFGCDFYSIIDDDPARFEAEALKGVYKMEIYSKDPAILTRMRNALAPMELAITSSFPTNIEITSKGLGKGCALAWLADHLNIPRENTMAFGDNTNDLPLITAAGIGVAMGNAAPELKAGADVVCGDCDKDGLANYLFENVLEGGF